MKLFKTITETKEVELDINLPYFCKDPRTNGNYYKVVSEKEVFQVTKTNYGFDGVIKSDLKTFLKNIVESEEVTEFEFNNVYENVLEELTVTV